MYSKHSKCGLFQTKVHYLGHVVSKEGIIVDPKNIRAIMEWENPRNMDEVRSFIAFASYYKRSIRKFSHISYIITSFQRNDNKIEWTEECVTSLSN